MQWASAACVSLAAAVLVLGAGPACGTAELHSFPMLLEPTDPPMACAAFCPPSRGSCLGFACLHIIALQKAYDACIVA